MIIVLTDRAKIGMDENGTPYITCPFCETWVKTYQYSTVHLPIKHPGTKEEIKKQARAKGK